MEHRELVFELADPEIYLPILLAQLSELGFDSFQEEPPILKAYVEENSYDDSLLTSIHQLDIPFKLIQDQKLQKVNWNEEWEKNFPPLAIEDFCYVRAPFHESKDGFQFVLEIEPKMSFGTGHHATTQNMILLMREMDLMGKSVLDLGSGTGILAILARKMGASEVIATDIEDWAYENMQENFERNNTADNLALLGSLPLSELKGRKFDIVLANINKNVLLDQMKMYSELLKEDAFLLLSGFYRNDENEVSAHCLSHNLLKIKEIENEEWMAVRYQLTEKG